MAELIALRTSGSRYVGGTSRITPYVGLEIAQAVIPDELLGHLLISDILNYREKSTDAYTAWFTEINRAAAHINGLDSEEITKVVATDFMPRLVDLRNSSQLDQSDE